jgi:hypothetical protein
MLMDPARCSPRPTEVPSFPRGETYAYKVVGSSYRVFIGAEGEQFCTESIPAADRNAAVPAARWIVGKTLRLPISMPTNRDMTQWNVATASTVILPPNKEVYINKLIGSSSLAEVRLSSTETTHMEVPLAGIFWVTSGAPRPASGLQDPDALDYYLG